MASNVRHYICTLWFLNSTNVDVIIILKLKRQLNCPPTFTNSLCVLFCTQQFALRDSYGNSLTTAQVADLMLTTKDADFGRSRDGSLMNSHRRGHQHLQQLEPWFSPFLYLDMLFAKLVSVEQSIKLLVFEEPFFFVVEAQMSLNLSFINILLIL